MILLLELARGLAALWVFLYHVSDILLVSSPFIYGIAKYGSLGVPMFFVISGYVITYSAESSLSNHKSPFVFLKSRFLRIYPAFWMSVLLLLLLPYLIEAISYLKSGFYILPSANIDKFSYSEWLNFLMLTKVFWATSHDLQTEFNTINSVYWTLAIEFQFYVVVFLALYFKSYYKWVISAVTAASVFILFFEVEVNFGLFVHYWPSFAVGVVLAYFHKSNIKCSNFFKGAISQSFLMVFAIFLLVYTVKQYELKGVLFSVLFGLFLWVVASTESILKKIKNSNNPFYYWLLEPWLMLGAMSYSVYLLHGKIYQIPEMFIRQVFTPENILYCIALILGTLILCYPFYYFVEKPFLSKNYKSLQKKVLEKPSAA